MILPTKHIDGNRCLLGVGARVLTILRRPKTVSALWEAIKRTSTSVTFENFSLTLAFLFSVGLIEEEKGVLRKTKR